MQGQGPEGLEHEVADAGGMAPVDVGVVEEAEEGGIGGGRVGGGEGFLRRRGMGGEGGMNPGAKPGIARSKAGPGT